MKTPPLSPRLALFLGTAALAAALAAPGSRAQAPGGSQPDAPAAARELQIYRLKYVSSAEVARALENIFGGGKGAPAARVIADARTNSVLVFVPAAQRAEVEKLIKALDVLERGGGGSGARQVHIVPLGNLVPDADLDKALRLVYDGREGKFALDRQRRAVVLSGDPELREEAEQLLLRLDARQAVRQKVGDLRVRLVWLVSGLKREDLAAAPADLGDVTAELARLGVDNLRLAAQVLVNAPLEAPFQAEGTARLDVPCRVGVAGTLSEVGGELGLEVELTARRAAEGEAADKGPARVGQICSLRTRITTPLGHAVVVGVTPTDGTTSVFVVQVLRKEAKAEPKKGR